MHVWAVASHHVGRHRIETLNGHTLDGRYSSVGCRERDGTE